MNARKIWTNSSRNPRGGSCSSSRWRNLPCFHPHAAGPQPKPDNTPVPSQATQAKSYSFHEDIEPLSRPRPPRLRERPTGSRAPRPPQAAATHPADDLRDEGAIRQRMVLAVWPAASLRAGEHGGFHEHRHADHRARHRGHLERRAFDHSGGHGGSWCRPEVSGSRTHRLRPPVVPGLSGRQGASHSGSVLDYAPKNPIRGRNRTAPRACAVRREVRQIRRSQGNPRRDDLSGAGAFPETTTLISPLGGATQLNNGGIDSAFPRGCKPEGSFTRSAFWSGSTRTRSTSAFPRAHILPLRHANGRSGQSHRRPFRFRSTANQPDSPMKSCHAIILSASLPVAHEKSRSIARWKCPAQRLRRQKCRKSARRRR